MKQTKQKHIRSLCQDIVYAARKKQKYLTVGLALNSLTCSRRVVGMMRRLDRCTSYYTVKEIENKMAIEVTKSVKATPFRMSLNASAATGIT